MRKKLVLVSFFIAATGLIGVYFLNRRFKFIDLSTISVTTGTSLLKSKVKIKKGLSTIDRHHDTGIFSAGNADKVVYDRRQIALLQTGYGENDFLILYDDQFYYRFRHFIFNRSHQHQYNFSLWKQNDTIYLKAAIEGEDEMHFASPMQPVRNAETLRLNLPPDRRPRSPLKTRFATPKMAANEKELTSLRPPATQIPLPSASVQTPRLLCPAA